AEDGIRGFHVTGVQTCALPICAPRPRLADAAPPGVAGRLRLAGPSAGPRAAALVHARHAAVPLRARAVPLAFAKPALVRGGVPRSEERRVGKERGCRGSPCAYA